MEVMGAWKFNQDLIRTALAKMIASDELSVRFLEGEGFRNLMNLACPRFKIPSKWIVSKDIFNIYVEERIKLKTFFKSNYQRVCLTIDS